MDDKLTQDLKSLRIDRGQKARGGASRRKLLVVGALLLVALLVAAVLSFVPEKAALTSLGAKPREVQTVMVVRQSPSADTVVLTAGGYIIPRHRIDIASKLSGRVEEVLFEKGDLVKAGQVLARIDDREIRAQLAQARANRQAAQARLDEAVAGSRPQELQRAQATLEQAEANLRTAKLNLDRARQLNQTGVWAKQALDDAQNNYDVAAAQAKVARENYELTRIGPRQEQIELSRAQVAEADATIRWFETQLENAVIRAPVDGTILDRGVEKGEMLTTGYFGGGGRGPKPGLGSLADLKELEVELDINEADISRVHLGQVCTVSPDSYPDRKYKARVREIAPEANRQKATIQVKVAIESPDKYLRPETNAKVNFLEESKPSSGENRILIPKSAVADSQGASSVYLIKDGRAVRRGIKTSRELGGQIEVISGLVGGEQLIVRGLEGITDGERVTVKHN
jgi:HlyD family secretion protein